MGRGRLSFMTYGDCPYVYSVGLYIMAQIQIKTRVHV